MWAIVFLVLYGTFVICVETWLESRDKQRATKRRGQSLD